MNKPYFIIWIECHFFPKVLTALFCDTDKEGIYISSEKREPLLENETFLYLSIYGSTVLLLGLGSFFSFLILYTVDRTPWMGDRPVVRPLPTQDNTNTEYTHTDIHALSGIRTHDPRVRGSEENSCLRQSSHCDRQTSGYRSGFYLSKGMGKHKFIPRLN
jgi:hypothetical protein